LDRFAISGIFIIGVRRWCIAFHVAGKLYDFFEDQSLKDHFSEMLCHTKGIHYAKFSAHFHLRTIQMFAGDIEKVFCRLRTFILLALPSIDFPITVAFIAAIVAVIIEIAVASFISCSLLLEVVKAIVKQINLGRQLKGRINHRHCLRNGRDGGSRQSNGKLLEDLELGEKRSNGFGIEIEGGGGGRLGHGKLHGSCSGREGCMAHWEGQGHEVQVGGGQRRKQVSICVETKYIYLSTACDCTCDNLTVLCRAESRFFEMILSV
jgi:hypothetical protein